MHDEGRFQPRDVRPAQALRAACSCSRAACRSTRTGTSRARSSGDASGSRHATSSVRAAARRTTAASPSRVARRHAHDRRRPLLRRRHPRARTRPDGAALRPAARLSGRRPTGRPTSATRAYALAYLDVWGRHVTALDDPRLREVALGGPDTDTRLKRVWQVKVLPLAVTASSDELAALQKKRAALAQKRAAAAAAAGDTADGPEGWTPRSPSSTPQSPRCPPARACDAQFDEWDALVADPRPHAERAHHRPAARSRARASCRRQPATGGSRTSSTASRCTTAATPATPTFKWSRDNGTVVTHDPQDQRQGDRRRRPRSRRRARLRAPASGSS